MNATIKDFFEAIKKTDYLVTPEIESQFKDKLPTDFLLAAKYLTPSSVKMVAEDFQRQEERNGKDLRKTGEKTNAPEYPFKAHPHGRFPARSHAGLSD